MRHVRLFRALLGGAGLAACVGLLAGQARADIVEFVPVRSLHQAATDMPRVPLAAPGPARTSKRAKAAPDPADSRSTDCDGHRIAMAPVRGRAPD